MSTIDEHLVGEFYQGPDGKIYQLVTYCRHPTATMQEIGTEYQIGGAVGCRNLEGFTLIEDNERRALLKQLMRQIKLAGDAEIHPP